MKKIILSLFTFITIYTFSQEPVLVRHDYPGSDRHNKGNFRNLRAVGNTLFFVTDDGVHGSELFKSDGTEAGTLLVKDIYQGKSKSSPSVLMNFNNQLFFYAYTGSVNGVNLWKSDGTEAGTVKVASIKEASGNSLHASYLVIDNTLFLESSTSRGDSYGLWKTDGTETGTLLVKAFNRIPGISNSLNSFTAFKNKIYFTAYDSLKGVELWVSDGTEAGTIMLKDIMPGDGESHSGVGGLTVVGNELFFAANDGVNGSELWKTDGTEAGTIMVKDIKPGDSGSSLNYLRNVNGTLYFSANDGTHGQELWKSNGTEAGTVLIKDIIVGTVNFKSGSAPKDLIAAGNTLYFIADDGVHGSELWKSNGTETGTVLIKDTFPGKLGGASNNTVVAYNNYVFFKGTDTNGQEPWISDGTEAGTKMLKDTNLNNTTYAKYFDTKLYIGRGTITDNGNFYFLSFDGVNGTEPSLWKLDLNTLSVKNELKTDLTNVSIYPNPASNNLNIEVDNQQIKSVKIFNLLGKEVMQKSINNSSLKNINISQLTKGMYVIQLKTADNSFTRKFIKQ
ncbi:putative secreted protein (Por secretion system target) [Lutibacter sp. Hel_I_33_5]|uniref:ELWxxDGT repeat protein n=1 Tax=Lutibacter sp. Hel_I_33_5 TaxID=1566289 RepID=UPI0011A45CB2|nr:ELWxxDGT repeat protein [Lutibacter sp. Hel_I_33_5]TVZ56146.1 putative secreted protein (Por secretion system target) [Lutibacter sp. Hel_I_33_5]